MCSVEIPVLDSNEVVELFFDQLPDGEEVIQILKREYAQIHIWVTLAMEYYKQNKVVEFVNILKASLGKEANTKYNNSEKDQMKALDTLAAYYVQQAKKEKKNGRKQELFNKAKHLYTKGDEIIMHDPNHLLGRAYFFLLEGNKMDEADAHLNVILKQSPNNIPSLLGKACISFNKKDYKAALAYYEKALRTNATCPANVRLGMGHCFLKLGNINKARLAFQRALDLDRKCIGALVGLAILEFNLQNDDNFRNGVQLLYQANAVDDSNSMVLNHLANYLFLNKKYKEVKDYALHAYHYTKHEAMRAESCYQLARVFHVEEDYVTAFEYYHQAIQFESRNFILPYFGLGQMYLYRGDTENAVQCFERVIKAQPGNYETMKVLGSLYAVSSSQSKRDIAKTYFIKVTEQFPDDFESWINLGQILEQSDLHGSLSAYSTAMKLWRQKFQTEIPLEIYNNVGALYYRLGNLDASRNYFEHALECTKSNDHGTSQTRRVICVTTFYNLARIYEGLYLFDKAENNYKEILKEHPKYIDAYLRLGCMARDRGQFKESLGWYLKALQIDNKHSDTWCLIGNLHLKKSEFKPAQKKFETILKNPTTSKDSYSFVALGNIWLHLLHAPTQPKEKQIQHQERVLQLFTSVLTNEPRNIWAANGIGCLLAHKNCISEAREIFKSVQEATMDFPDVWLNIAHIYVVEEQFVPAIQMYKNCMLKFFQHPHLEILQYLARAQFLADQFNEAKISLMKAQHVAPHNTVYLFNISLVIKQKAIEILNNKNSDFRTVVKAKTELLLSHKFLEWLSVKGDVRAAAEIRNSLSILSKLKKKKNSLLMLELFGDSC